MKKQKKPNQYSEGEVVKILSDLVGDERVVEIKLCRVCDSSHANCSFCKHNPKSSGLNSMFNPGYSGLAMIMQLQAVAHAYENAR